MFIQYGGVFVGKKSFQSVPTRFPSATNGIDINGCKQPICESFGFPASSDENDLSKNYKYIISSSGKLDATIKCKACANRNEESQRFGTVFYPIKSNKAIVEEIQRISEYLNEPVLTCPNPLCPTHLDGVPAQLKKRGKTKSGSQRYYCHVCKTSFTFIRKKRQQLRSEVNKMVFSLLVNKVVLKRISRVCQISMQTLYDKIDFIHQQCVQFVAQRERNLTEKSISRLYLATDRQVHISNWTRRKDKRNTELYGIGTACLDSGYVFAVNFNFDPKMNPVCTEGAAIQAGDYDKPKYHREYARVWLRREFEEASRKKTKVKQHEVAMSLEESIALKSKYDVENNQDLSSEDIDEFTQTSEQGMLIHNEYTQIAHFYFLKRLFKNVEKTRFYMDLDAGMKNAYISAFREEIQSGDSDGFIVKTTKNTTQEEKRRFRKNSIKNINELKGVSFDDLSAPERKNIIASIIEDELDNLLVIKDSTERWLKHPLATLNEPEKMIAAVTPINRYDKTHQAHLYRKATLHPIDRFFMQIRRSVLLFERPMSSGSNAGRVWNGYGAYNPDMYNILADIYRVYYNYVEIGKDGKTPAMRLGLAKGPVSIEKIIYFAKN